MMCLVTSVTVSKCVIDLIPFDNILFSAYVYGINKKSTESVCAHAAAAVGSRL